MATLESPKSSNETRLEYHEPSCEYRNLLQSTHWYTQQNVFLTKLATLLGWDKDQTFTLILESSRVSYFRRPKQMEENFLVFFLKELNKYLSQRGVDENVERLRNEVVPVIAFAIKKWHELETALLSDKQDAVQNIDLFAGISPSQIKEYREIIKAKLHAGKANEQFEQYIDHSNEKGVRLATGSSWEGVRRKAKLTKEFMKRAVQIVAQNYKRGGSKEILSKVTSMSSMLAISAGALTYKWIEYALPGFYQKATDLLYDSGGGIGLYTSIAAGGVLAVQGLMIAINAEKISTVHAAVIRLIIAYENLLIIQPGLQKSIERAFEELLYKLGEEGRGLITTEGLLQEISSLSRADDLASNNDSALDDLRKDIQEALGALNSALQISQYTKIMSKKEVYTSMQFIMFILGAFALKSIAWPIVMTGAFSVLQWFSRVASDPRRPISGKSQIDLDIVREALKRAPAITAESVIIANALLQAAKWGNERRGVHEVEEILQLTEKDVLDPFATQFYDAIALLSLSEQINVQISFEPNVESKTGQLIHVINKNKIVIDEKVKKAGIIKEQEQTQNEDRVAKDIKYGVAIVDKSYLQNLIRIEQEQIYLMYKDGNEVRIRREIYSSGNHVSFTLTIKSKMNDGTRKEKTYIISHTLYRHLKRILFEKKQATVVRKTRYIADQDNPLKPRVVIDYIPNAKTPWIVEVRGVDKEHDVNNLYLPSWIKVGEPVNESMGSIARSLSE